MSTDGLVIEKWPMRICKRLSKLLLPLFEKISDKFGQSNLRISYILMGEYDMWLRKSIVG